MSKDLFKAETYSEPRQISKIERFEKIVNGCSEAPLQTHIKDIRIGISQDGNETHVNIHSFCVWNSNLDYLTYSNHCNVYSRSWDSEKVYSLFRSSIYLLPLYLFLSHFFYLLLIFLTGFTVIFWELSTELQLGRGGSRTAGTFKMRLEAVNYYHKALHLRCCSSPISASESREAIIIRIAFLLFSVCKLNHRSDVVHC